MKNSVTAFRLGCRKWIVLLLTGLTIHATHASKVWTGSAGNGDWFTPGNWSGDVCPAAGDEVLIGSGASVALSNSTPVLGSFTITNATLTFTNWTTALSATNVVLRNGANLTLPNAFTDSQMSNRVYIVCTDFTMDAGATISTGGRGFAGASASNQSGHGPGKGLAAGGNHYLAGAGHGGTGGDGTSGQGGRIYGDHLQPLFPGSGGAGNGGGRGGGAVRIDASGAVVINGTINANATVGTPYGGGGSGGSIWINGHTLAGSSSGLLTASGGNGGKLNGGGGGGAGGRIAIHYDQAAQAALERPRIRFSTAAGLRTYSDHKVENGEPGSLYLPDTLLLSETPSNFLNVRLYGITNWSVGHLSMTNCVLWFAEEGFALTVTNSIHANTGAGLHMPSHSVLHCGGDLVLTNGGSLTVYGGPTNALTPPYGALVSVTGTMAVAGSSWVHAYPEFITNGPARPPMLTNLTVAAPLFRMGSLTVAAGGGFNANGLGFAGGVGNSDSGHGPGKGLVGSYYGGGGGHGGAGGTGSNGAGGAPYGQTNAPVQPGSGGGGSWAGRGGGAIWIEATGRVKLAGTLRANATSGITYGGGGSGGSILVLCDTLELAATTAVSVRGGNAGQTTSKSAGGGAGGRIAFGIGLDAAARDTLKATGTVPGLFSFDRYQGPAGFSVTATNGINATYPARNGNPGTAVFVTTNLTLNIKGDPEDAGLPSPQPYGRASYEGSTPTITNSVATPADEQGGSRWECIGWRLTTTNDALIDTGTSSQAVIELTQHAELTWLWTNSYQLIVESSSISNGSVNADGVNGWYTNGTLVAGIVAVASNGYAFSTWTGDVPPGHETDNPLTVTMTQPRTLSAAFVSSTGGRKVWNGTGVWEDSARWSPPGMPGALDEVLIEDGTVLLGQSRDVVSLTVSNNATLVFTNWSTVMTASNIVIMPAAVVTLPPPFTDSQMSNRVYFACTNFVLATNAVIDVDGRGFRGGQTEGSAGHGPGKGAYALYYGGGGGHGGAGGSGTASAGGNRYGDAAAPLFPGSGGAGTGSAAGGGAVRIVAAQRATIDGTITANGINTSSYGGGGSGGSIYISALEIAGNGLLRANGGNTSYISNGSGGGGGGGRIALEYDPAAQSVLGRTGLRFSAALSTSGAKATGGEPGTLYLPDTTFLSTTMTNVFDGVIFGVTHWSGSSLVISNRSIRFGEPGLTIDVTGEIVIQTNGELELPAYARLACDGNLRLLNGSRLRVQAGVTNETIAHGALVDVNGDMLLESGAWVFPSSDPTNNAASYVWFRMNDFTVAANAGFNAVGLGFAGGAGNSQSGYGPGRGLVGSYYGGGGGHGGAGGNGSHGNGGLAYDSTNAPVQPGSGGGGSNAGSGGGAFRIDARGMVVIDGTLTANASNGLSYGGGGAGGSIWVTCQAFSGAGSAVISAIGGNAGQSSSASAGGGGGGRIAIWYGNPNEDQKDELASDLYPRNVLIEDSPDEFLGSVSAANGINATYPARNGSPGSVVFIRIPPPGGTVFMIR